MTHHVFGAKLDVHSGGIDLRFPHHNNEIAQCDAHRLAADAAGDAADRWCGHFVHFGHLYIRGRKMSKSLKNFVSVREFLDEHGEAQGADLFRFFCLQHKYRANVVYSDDRMRDARAAADRVRSFLLSLEALGRQQDPDHKKRCEESDMEVLRLVFDTRARFDEALKDDIDTPRALQLVLDLLARGHEYLVVRPGLDAPAEVLGVLAAFVLEVLELFGLMGLHGEFAPALHPLQLAGSMMSAGGAVATTAATSAATGASEADREADEALLRTLVQFRASVRQEALKNPRDPASAQILQLCDALRNAELPALGVQVEDLSPGRAVYKKLSDPVLQEEQTEAPSAPSSTEDEDAVKQALREKQRAFEALMKIDPRDFLREAPEFAARFADFDADGVPALDAQTREPLTKSQRKKLLKKRDKHAKSFAKYWEQQQSDS
jgi:cysteinyl-tRNA synthetase